MDDNETTARMERAADIAVRWRLVGLRIYNITETSMQCSWEDFALGCLRQHPTRPVYSMAVHDGAPACHAALDMGDGLSLVSCTRMDGPPAPSPDRMTLNAIHALLNGKTWSSDTCDAIAAVLVGVGYTIDDPDADIPDDERVIPACSTCDDTGGVYTAPPGLGGQNSPHYTEAPCPSCTPCATCGKRKLDPYGLDAPNLDLVCDCEDE